MENILFKAQNAEQKWVYGLIKEDNDGVYINGTKCNEKTICQYTTYKDKFKNKIFIHDRVRIEFDGLRYDGTVVFRDGRIVIDWDNESVSHYFYRVDLAFWKKFMTVIGNEYDELATMNL